MKIWKNGNWEKSILKNLTLGGIIFSENGNWRKFELKNKNKRKRELGEREIGQIS